MFSILRLIKRNMSQKSNQKWLKCKKIPYIIKADRIQISCRENLSEPEEKKGVVQHDR